MRLSQQWKTYVSHLLSSFIPGFEIVTLNLLLVTLEDFLLLVNPAAIASIFFVCLSLLLTLIALGRQPQSSGRLSFRVPCVPVIPFLSVGINVYLMMKLSAPTWVRFLIWMILGFLIYFGYGISHSTGALTSEEKRQREVERNAHQLNGTLPS